MSKIIVYKEEARAKLKAGVDAVANAVKVTIGGSGRLVVIGQAYSAGDATKDGVSVSDAIELECPLENEGARMVKQAARKTVKDCDDGTSTTIVLTQALVDGGIKAVTAGFNPMDLKRGVEKAVSFITNNLNKMSTPVKGKFIKDIATVSANNDETIGTLIAEATTKVGFDGLIMMEESRTGETYTEYLEGMMFEANILSPFFITNPQTMESEQSNPLIMLCDCKIENFGDIIPALEIAVDKKKELFVVSEDVSNSVIAALVNNRQQGGLKVTVVRAPFFGDSRTNFLQDLAALTGATLISEELEMNVRDVTPEMLGEAVQVIAGREKVSIIGGKGKESDIKKRITEIKTNLKLEKEDHVIVKLKKRLAKLQGGVAVVYVGGATDIELGERRARVEDALGATRAAIEEGILPGGGTALLRAVEGIEKLKYANEDELAGIRIVIKAIEAPIRQILSNAGLDASLIVGKIREGKAGYGYNLMTNQYEDLINSGIIDPAKVTRVALKYSSSIASMIMLTECLIVEKPEEGFVKPITNTGGLF